MIRLVWYSLCCLGVLYTNIFIYLIWLSNSSYFIQFHGVWFENKSITMHRLQNNTYRYVYSPMSHIDSNESRVVLYVSSVIQKWGIKMYSLQNNTFSICVAHCTPSLPLYILDHRVILQFIQSLLRMTRTWRYQKLFITKQYFPSLCCSWYTVIAFIHF